MGNCIDEWNMRVCVFCASAEVDRKYMDVARELGTLIAEVGGELVYGGTNCGLMREVSDAVEVAGGKVTGVIARCIAEKGVAAKGLNELVVTEDMKERKSRMREMADAFVVLPGGWGTLEEATEVITLKQLGLHDKPVVFVNTEEYFEYFFLFLHGARREGFISRAYDDLYVVVEEPKDALDYILNYQPRSRKDKYV